jgi:hypothetical protein
MASLKLSDLVLTGSNDGAVRFWKAQADTRCLEEVFTWDVGPGFVNSIAVNSQMVVLGMGNEHRLGRWWRLKGARNRIVVARLPEGVSTEGGKVVEEEEESSTEDGEGSLNNSGSEGEDDGSDEASEN